VGWGISVFQHNATISPEVRIFHAFYVTALFLGGFALFAQSDRGDYWNNFDPALRRRCRQRSRPAIRKRVWLHRMSSVTGNYDSVSAVGEYEIRVSVAGFKKFIRQGLTVQNAQTIRIDIALEVGSATEAVTVTEAAPLLKTESGELSHVVSIQRMDSLPVLQTGGSAGSGGIRIPIAVVALIPGSAMTIGTSPTVRINGGVNNCKPYW
jgi:hypothetical protein